MEFGCSEEIREGKTKGSHRNTMSATMLLAYEAMQREGATDHVSNWTLYEEVIQGSSIEGSYTKVAGSTSMSQLQTVS